MKRLFYLSVGVAAGVYASRRLTRAAQAWTPEGIADGAAGVGAAVRDAAGEVRAHAAEREAELRDTLGLDRLLENVNVGRDEQVRRERPRGERPREERPGDERPGDERPGDERPRERH